nr:hypothetical protein [Tanacetum cinerariifolium]
MEAGGKDRPPILSHGNYVQWKSRIKRYIDTKPNNEHIHYCLQNPPYKFKWTEKTILVAEGSSKTTTKGYTKNYKNVSQDIRNQLYAEAKAIQIILTGIDNDIYSTSQELNTVFYHKLYDILKQHHNKVNELRAERLARTANPLALVAQQQPAYHLQNHLTHYTHNSSTRSQQAATKNREKAIVNSPPLTYDQEPEIVAEDDELTSSNTSRVIKIMLQESTEALEQADWRDDTDDEPDDQELEAHYMYMARIQEFTPDAADNSGPIFDTEPLHKVHNDNDNYNAFANDKEHPEQPESVNDTYVEEQADTNITIDSLDMSTNGEMVD